MTMTTSRNALKWAHDNLFSSSLNTVLTLACVCLIIMIGVPLVNWLFINAYWSGSTPADCPDKSAACWPFVRARFDQFMYGLYPAAERWRIHLGLGLIILAAAPLFIPRFPGKRWLLPLLVIACPLIGTGLFLGGVFGLEYVETGKWGGFFLTVITALFVLSTSLPIAVMLALGRSSSIPLVRVCCATWIELWRSVPALVVLFVAIIMFPLFMPEEIEIDKLLRALCALTVLMSCYMAEAIRGALQSIRRGNTKLPKRWDWVTGGARSCHTAPGFPGCPAADYQQLHRVVQGNHRPADHRPVRSPGNGAERRFRPDLDQPGRQRHRIPVRGPVFLAVLFQPVQVQRPAGKEVINL